MALPINWERVEIEETNTRTKHEGMVWLTSTGKANNFKLNKVNISADLAKEVDLKDGDSVWLYRSGDTFMIRKESSDFVVHGESTVTLTNANFVAKILSVHNNYDAKKGDAFTSFEAIVIDGGIVFEV